MPRKPYCPSVDQRVDGLYWHGGSFRAAASVDWHRGWPIRHVSLHITIKPEIAENGCYPWTSIDLAARRNAIAKKRTFIWPTSAIQTDWEQSSRIGNIQ